jgi:transposase InsO family protein
MLLHLPRMDGYGVEPRVNNGPALAGRDAEAVRDTIADTVTNPARAAAPLADLGPRQGAGPACSGWAYVAFVLDAFSRRIVGWQVANHMRTDLPLDALEMALWRQKIKKARGLPGC